jgi:hypothetical protein
MKSERTWRTRVDPFGEVWEQIRRQIQTNPRLEAKALFTALQRQHPGKFGDGQLRTLQRRIRSWRAAEGRGKGLLVPRRIRLAKKPQQNSKPALMKRKLTNQQAFLAAFEESCCVRWAARAARITRKTHYHWLHHHAAYAHRFREAQKLAADVLESEAVKRATEGWQEPIYYQGNKVGSVTRYDSGMLQFLLRGAMPEKYGNKKPQIPAPGVAPVQPKVTVVFANDSLAEE